MLFGVWRCGACCLTFDVACVLSRVCCLLFLDSFIASGVSCFLCIVLVLFLSCVCLIVV